MAYSAHNRNGASIRNPSLAQMQVLLESLTYCDPEHPDVGLKHESQWCLSAFGSGLLVFENVETGEGPWHMRGILRERVLELWQLLASGNVRELQLLPWEPGYGVT
jgi:hypothetical protein